MAVVRWAVMLAVTMTTLLSCGSRAVPEGPTDAAFVRSFLETWLVDRDVAQANSYLAADFFIHPALRDDFKDGNGVLRFGYECEHAPRTCGELSDCVSGIESSGDFDFSTRTVTANMVKEIPELRSREGREVISADFKLKGCNLGAFLLLEKDAPDQRRVITIVYMAG